VHKRRPEKSKKKREPSSNDDSSDTDSDKGKTIIKYTKELSRKPVLVCENWSYHIEHEIFLPQEPDPGERRKT